jgi:hypothetical protein
MKLIIFKIDKTNAIIFELPQVLAEAFRYDEIFVFLNQNNQNKNILYQDFLIEALRAFKRVLDRALDNKLQLHHSITKNIGYVWNEYLHDIEVPMELDAMGSSFWVGQKHLIWNARSSDAATWLYESEGRFWFEVTLDYRWHFSDPKEGEEFISYEESMKAYKPIVIFEVSREDLEQWLERVRELVVLVEANDSKYLIKMI